MKYLIIVEKAKRGFSAYAPDVPGCVAAGPTRRAVERLMLEAIRFHMDELRSDGVRLPVPVSYSKYVDVPS